MGFQELPNYEPPQTVKSLVDQIISSNPNWDLKAQSQFKTIIQQQLSLNFNTLLVDRSRWIPPISPISKSLPSLIIQSAETRKLRYRSMAAYKEDVNDLRLVVNEISKELQELNINTDNIKEFSTDDAFVVLEDLQEKFSDKKQIVEKIEKVARRLAVLNTPIGR
jgi:3-hydroxyacyl-CoA dehydrogenase